MKVLLDTNIIIHRETNRVIRDDIGILFKWLEKMHYDKYIHPHTISEIEKYKDPELIRVFRIKLGSYNVISALPAMDEKVKLVAEKIDNNDNDRVDSEILNLHYLGVTDLFITEDKKIRQKAKLLGIESSVLSIEEFLEKANSENPSLADYKVLAVKKAKFGDLDLSDDFFNSFRSDYVDFDKWFRKKNEETAYVCQNEGKILAFLYLKSEDTNEVYSDITPNFSRKKRLKIGTFKVVLNGVKLGERFLKIIFDNAIILGSQEIYVTVFNHSLEQDRLIGLLEQYGFSYHGVKSSASGVENVYVRQINKSIQSSNQKHVYPFIKSSSRAFLVPIYEKYHTELFPDSILNTESPFDFIENEPYRNAISKVYISRSRFSDLLPGDNIVFYRTGGFYKGVITTIGIVENVTKNIPDFTHFKKCCGKRTIFTEKELKEHWDYYPSLKPFVVQFLYSYSFSKRLNLAKLIEIGVIRDINSVPRGFEPISSSAFKAILRETKTNESLIID